MIYCLLFSIRLGGSGPVQYDGPNAGGGYGQPGFGRDEQIIPEQFWIQTNIRLEDLRCRKILNSFWIKLLKFFVKLTFTTNLKSNQVLAQICLFRTNLDCVIESSSVEKQYLMIEKATKFRTKLLKQKKKLH